MRVACFVCVCVCVVFFVTIVSIVLVMYVDVSRLPKFQDCHEMWSRRKRKKEAKGADSGKSRPQSSGGSAVKPLGSRPASLSPVLVQRESSQPPADSGVQHPLSQEILPVPKSLAVPLPSAPLTDNILESLKASAPEGAVTLPVMPLLGQNQTSHAPVTMATVPVAAVSPGRAQQLQKVIEVQRSLISELSKQLGTDTSRVPTQSQQPCAPQYFSTALLQPHTHAQTLPSAKDTYGGRAKQTFDYNNQSNKQLEKEADAQMEREYYGECRWHTP